jgi:uncharacterized membrane protein YjjP (DUF1212 family)
MAHTTPLQERRSRRFANLARETSLHATDHDLHEVHLIVRRVSLDELSLSDAHALLKAMRRRQRFPDELAA